MLALTSLVGCGGNNNAQPETNTEATQPEANDTNNDGTVTPADLRVGMVTDAGTIDDKSLNQGTWEGILAAENQLGITPKYLKPNGTTEAEYLAEIGNLYDADYKFIVTPGFKFETAIFAAQDQYTDAKFIIIEVEPNNGDNDNYDAKDGDNTVAVYFSEHE